MITNKKWIETRLRNLLLPKYNNSPIYSIRFEYDTKFFGLQSKITNVYLEVHTANWEKKLLDSGFTFIKDGYFSKIYTFPVGMLD